MVEENKKKKKRTSRLVRPSILGITAARLQSPHTFRHPGLILGEIASLCFPFTFNSFVSTFPWQQRVTSVVREGDAPCAYISLCLAWIPDVGIKTVL